MKKTTSKNKGRLGNPAAVAATAVAGKAASEVAVKTVPWLIKVAVIGGVIYVGYRIISGQFVKAKYNSNYNDANVSDAVAQAKAESIYQAMYGYGANVQVVAEQLFGLNYNGWIKVYNAFGKRQPWNVFADPLTLVEWFNDQFDTSEMSILRTALPNVF